ncbi:MAG TPA: hypothetical protein VJI15_03715 [Candidatus Nanoarchaeia archaeon]|nr:hypothetical protein [Candidatus Nanoarchaeia archaeon]
MPDGAIETLSPMQVDAGMAGYTRERLVAREVAVNTAIDNYTAGASRALRLIAEQCKLDYTPLIPPR